MLGEPISMLVPQVVGFELTGELPERRDRNRSRPHGHRDPACGSASSGSSSSSSVTAWHGLPLADRATIANMAPECGATLQLLPDRRRDASLPSADGAAGPSSVALVEAYAKEQLPLPRPGRPRRRTRRSSSSTSATSSRASPVRAGPQDRVPLAEAKSSFAQALTTFGVGLCERRTTRRSLQTFPASDPPADAAPGSARHRARAGRSRRDGPSTADKGDRLARRRDIRSHARRGRHRRDHELHEHVEPGRDGRRRAAREARRRAGPRRAALGQVEPRARVEGRHRVSGSSGSDALPRRARIQPRRLRLHDVHRELGPAPRADLARRSARATSSSAPSCPGTGTSRRASIRRSRPTTSRLPRSSSPTRSRGAWTSISNRAARPRLATARPSSCASCGRRRRRSTGWSRTRFAEEMFASAYADVFAGDERWNALDIPSGDLYGWDPASTYVRRPPYFDGHGPRARAGRRHHGCPLPRHGRRQRDDRPHLARPAPSGRTARPAAT